MAEPIDVRAEFDGFFKSAYPWLASQLHAITGDADTARWAVDAAFVRCWQSWASVRKLADPMGWVRWTAIRVAAGTRRELPFRRRTAEPSAITEGSEEGVVLDALHRLPASQRRAIVLHYMGDVTVAELSRRSGTTPDAVEWLLDTGFDSLVGLLTWPDEPGAEPASDPADETFDPRYDWTAEALGDTATRLAADVSVPAPAAVLQRAAIRRWARRAVPIAVSAACVSGVVLLAAQLNPAGSSGPRTPYTYSVAAPAPYEAAQPYGTEPVAGEPVAEPAPREMPLGTSIVSVARSTPLEDFGVSAPAAAPAGPGSAVAAGSPSPVATGSVGTPGGSTTTSAGGAAAPAAGGGSGTVPPASSAPGTVPPVSSAPGTVPPVSSAPGTIPPVSSAPGTIPPVSSAPGTIPPSTIPPTTVPPVTVPPTTAPPTTPPTTTPPTTLPTTEPTTVAPTTTEAPAATVVTTVATTTKTTTTPPEPTTTEATTTTTKPAPTTTPVEDPTVAATS